MQTSLRIAVTNPDDEIRAYMAGGKIPVIMFGSQYAADIAELAVNTTRLTPAEQGAFLRRLAAAATDLAAQAEGAPERVGAP